MDLSEGFPEFWKKKVSALSTVGSLQFCSSKFLTTLLNSWSLNVPPSSTTDSPVQKKNCPLLPLCYSYFYWDDILPFQAKFLATPIIPHFPRIACTTWTRPSTATWWWTSSYLLCSLCSYKISAWCWQLEVTDWMMVPWILNTPLHLLVKQATKEVILGLWLLRSSWSRLSASLLPLFPISVNSPYGYLV